MLNEVFGIVKADVASSIARDDLFAVFSPYINNQDVICEIHQNVAIAYSSNKIKAKHETKSDCKKFGIAGFFNGEIHNFEELYGVLEQKGYVVERNVHDLAVHLYIEFGETFATQINGLFSFIIHDKKRNTVVAGVDRFGGANPLYYVVSNDGIYISSRLRGVARLVGERSIDFKAMGQFLKHAFIVSPYSIFQGVKKVVPGHLLLYRNGILKTAKYWDFSVPHQLLDNEVDAVKQYRAFMERSVVQRLDGEGGVGFLLSGGLDSGVIVATASKAIGKPIKTFTVGFDNHYLDESDQAALISTQYNTRHHRIALTPSLIYELPRLIWELEEPFLESGLLLGYAAYKEAAKHVKTILIGDGADQIFGTDARQLALRFLVDKMPFSAVLKKTFFALTDNHWFRNGKKTASNKRQI